MKASSLSFQAAVLLVLVGMVWGIVMAVSQDHSSMPAHAHLNLLGWVSLFLFGIFYHLHPAIDRSRVALAHRPCWQIDSRALRSRACAQRQPSRRSDCRRRVRRSICRYGPVRMACPQDYAWGPSHSAVRCSGRVKARETPVASTPRESWSRLTASSYARAQKNPALPSDSIKIAPFICGS